MSWNTLFIMDACFFNPNSLRAYTDALCPKSLLFSLFIKDFNNNAKAFISLSGNTHP